MAHFSSKQIHLSLILRILASRDGIFSFSISLKMLLNFYFVVKSCFDNSYNACKEFVLTILLSFGSSNHDDSISKTSKHSFSVSVNLDKSKAKCHFSSILLAHLQSTSISFSCPHRKSERFIVIFSIASAALITTSLVSECK